jgi:hypothetical protein
MCPSEEIANNMQEPCVEIFPGLRVNRKVDIVTNK